MLYEKPWERYTGIVPKNATYGGMTVSLDNTENLTSYIRTFIMFGDTDTLNEMGLMMAERFQQFVPYRHGALRDAYDIIIDKDRVIVTWDGPRAQRLPYVHYQYVGRIYNFNHIRWRNGLVDGWYSPPGEKKTPSDRVMIPNWRHTLYTKRENGRKFITRLGYTTPNTTHHWIEEVVNVPTNYNPLKRDMTNYLYTRLVENFGGKAVGKKYG